MAIKEAVGGDNYVKCDSEEELRVALRAMGWSSIKHFEKETLWRRDEIVGKWFFPHGEMQQVEVFEGTDKEILVESAGDRVETYATATAWLESWGF